ncbi:MAG: peptidase S9B dipeptidylpeptidase IV domain-containing protein [Bacteroidetes bacterium OLB11]|nr:MAG: peptidase S9B dipeptidylpeptidase IV domain-containing protein [Bacteroidetes bacterium OLB11]
MKKIIFLFILFSNTVFAQKKNFSMQEAVNGLATNLAVKNLSQLSWTGSSEYYVQVVANDSENVIIAYSPQTFESEVITSLEKLNNELKAKQIQELKRFPPLKWINHTQFYFFHENKYIQFNAEAKNVSNIEVLLDLPKDAENVNFNVETQSAIYTQDYNLYYKQGLKLPIQITQDGAKNILYGTSVHRDEFGISGGLFWSPDNNNIAFYRMDQTMVEDYPVVNWSNVPATVNMVKYPFAGRTSHQVKLGVYHFQTQKTIYLNTGEPMDQYLTCVSWSPDSKSIYVAVLNREQNFLKLNQYDATTGELIKTLFEEKNDKYVEPQHELYFMKSNPSEFVWWSQRDGYMHLYLYKNDGTLVRQLTKGNWVVNEILGYNKSTNELFFTSSIDNPLQKNVYAVSLNSSNIRTITKTKATHTANLSPDGNYLIDIYSNSNTPRNIEIINTISLDEKRIFTASNPLADYNTAKVVPVTLYADDSTILYGKLMLPSDFDSSKKYPTIVYLYNGPHFQLVRDVFPSSQNLWYDYMTQHGYIVFNMDGRGSSNRGFAFESIIHRQLGTVEMQDQLKGVQYLKSLPYVDSQNMGIHGWSYGGFMTTSFMLRNPDVFKCGVAGGPVLDWSMYEIMYGERYMDTPKENPKGYEENGLFDKINRLKGNLLLIHGTDDDVVVWQHSIKNAQKCSGQ